MVTRVRARARRRRAGGVCVCGPGPGEGGGGGGAPWDPDVQVVFYRLLNFNVHFSSMFIEV